MTTHQLFIRHAPTLGIDSYSTFCKLLELLDARGRVEMYYDLFGEWFEIKWPNSENWTVADCIGWCIDAKVLADNVITKRRVALLDGTVIREWPIDDYEDIF